MHLAPARKTEAGAPNHGPLTSLCQSQPRRCLDRCEQQHREDQENIAQGEDVPLLNKSDDKVLVLGEMACCVLLRNHARFGSDTLKPHHLVRPSKAKMT